MQSLYSVASQMIENMHARYFDNSDFLVVADWWNFFLIFSLSKWLIVNSLNLLMPGAELVRCVSILLDCLGTCNTYFKAAVASEYVEFYCQKAKLHSSKCMLGSIGMEFPIPKSWL